MYYYIHVTCYIFLYQRFKIKEFNQRDLIYLNFQTKSRYIFYKESVFIIIYTSKFINVLSFIISIILYIFISILFNSDILEYTNKIEFKVDFYQHRKFYSKFSHSFRNDIQNQTIDSENIANDRYDYFR